MAGVHAVFTALPGPMVLSWLVPTVELSFKLLQNLLVH